MSVMQRVHLGHVFPSSIVSYWIPRVHFDWYLQHQLVSPCQFRDHRLCSESKLQRLRKQLKNSIPHLKNKQAKARTHRMQCQKKLKRLTKGGRLLRKFTYRELIHGSNNQRKMEIKNERIEYRRRHGRGSTPNECELWNCPKKLRRKTRLSRRYPASPGSASTHVSTCSTRRRTPILQLRDSPIQFECNTWRL